MTEDSSTLTTELRDKIKSKMDVAKFFAAFISLLIGILLKNETLTSRWSKAGVVFFLFSLGFCVAAMSAYDHLLTPQKYLIETYWPDLSSRSKREQSYQDRLVEHMVSAWRFLFVPTLLCFGVGFSLVLVQELQPSVLTIWAGSASGFLLLILLVLCFLAPTAVYFSRLRPRKLSRGRKKAESNTN